METSSPKRMLFTYTLLLLALNHVGLGSLQDKQTDFGLRVFSQLSQSLTDKNMAMSPYGAVSIITMAQLGAAGKTLRALDSATGYSLLARGMSREQRLLHRDLSSEDRVETASAVMVERKMSLKKGYRRALVKAFQTHPHQVDFSKPEQAINIINEWVSDHTAGAIPDFLASGSLTDETRLVFLNALSFQALWKVPFNPKQTAERMFHCANGSAVPVHMMTLMSLFHYGEFVTTEGIDYDVIEIPYEGDTVSMLLVSPIEPEVPLGTVIADLSSKRIYQWRQEFRRVKRQLSMPRFTFNSEVDFKSALLKMGLGDVFNLATADFTKITTNEQLCVSKIMQKIKIEVNEHGTKAATASAAVMFSRMAVEEITLDRPFLFLIQHKPTGALLFTGQFHHPQHQ